MLNVLAFSLVINDDVKPINGNHGVYQTSLLVAPERVHHTDLYDTFKLIQIVSTYILWVDNFQVWWTLDSFTI